MHLRFHAGRTKNSADLFRSVRPNLLNEKKIKMNQAKKKLSVAQIKAIAKSKGKSKTQNKTNSMHKEHAINKME